MELIGNENLHSVGIIFWITYMIGVFFAISHLLLRSKIKTSEKILWIISLTLIPLTLIVYVFKFYRKTNYGSPNQDFEN